MSMTESEALAELKTFPVNCLDFKENQALQIAVDLLEQYRAIGTVEEFAYAKARVHLAELASDYMETQGKIFKDYVAIGTVSEFREAMFFKKYFMELYGEGLEVANWHLNGDLEPLDSFIDEALVWNKKEEREQNDG